MTRYEQLADAIARQISAGVLRPGERIPSVRQACAAQGVSPGRCSRRISCWRTGA